jgi:hypothetical protein
LVLLSVVAFRRYLMNGSRFLVTLTAINIGVLVLSVFNLVRPAFADTPVTAAVLRAHSLQIVDEQGRVRASLGLAREYLRLR